MSQERVAVYIDGFNLYHGLSDLNVPHLKWVNLKKLSKLLIRPVSQQLVLVKYFSAFADFYQNTPLEGKVRRHRAYVRALESKGVLCNMGNFAKRDLQFSSGRYRARWRRREEKQTDVAIGVHTAVDAFQNAFDTALIVSCDADMVPVLEVLKGALPAKRLITVAPPGRSHHRDLLNVSDGHIVIKRSQIERALFGPRVMANGLVIAYRPTAYKPRHR